jgi:hypothetical protein
LHMATRYWLHINYFCNLLQIKKIKLSTN